MEQRHYCLRHWIFSFKFAFFIRCLLIILITYFVTQIDSCNFQSKFPKNSHVSSQSSHPITENAITENEKHRVCYYALPNNMTSDPTLIVLYPEQIGPSLCTHIIIGFATFTNNNIIPRQKNDIQFYKRVLKLKKKSPQLKVMLSLAGNFSMLVENPETLPIFAFNAHQFLTTHGLDGLDLDWEFPAWPPKVGNAYEKTAFTHLVSQLFNALKLSSHPPLLLSIAVAGPSGIVDRSYEVSSLAKNVDFISIMCYDLRMFTKYFPFTGFNAALFKSPRTKVPYLASLNVASVANYWIEKGAPKEKLVVGIPTYGRTWRLVSFLWHGVGDLAVGEGSYNGGVSYPMALSFLRQGAKRIFDVNQKVPYAFMGREWVSYEDNKSIYFKAQWIKDQKFAGVMTWNLNCDDIDGEGTGRVFELHKIIKEVLLGLGYRELQ